MATTAQGAPLAGAQTGTPDMLPTKADDRIVALDFVRGAALFGILLMNITAFGLPAAYNNPLNAGGAEGANLGVWVMNAMLFEGTQRGLFSMLFGAGIILFTSRLEAKGRTDVADIYLRRNMWLTGFGLLNGFILLWSGDILYYYGLTAVLLFVFRNLAPRALLAIGVAGLLFNAGWNALDNSLLMRSHDAYVATQVEGATPTAEQKALAGEWEGALAEHTITPEKRDALIAERTAGYWSALKQTAALTVRFESWWFYRDFFDIFSMMIIGMALFKLGVFTLEKSTGFYLAMVAIGYGIGLSVNAYETRMIVADNFSLLAFSQAHITYDLGRLAMTAGHLGLLLLVVRSGIVPAFQRALAAVGRMAFTNYLTHSVVCAIFFVGLGYYGQLQRHELYFVVIAIWIAQLIISPMWLRAYSMGPMEWVWRYLTYGSAPALRKAAPAVA